MTTSNQWLSPLHKLVPAFQNSRDQWKEKCLDAKYQLKLVKRRFHRSESSKAQWKQRCKAAEIECQQLRHQLERLLKTETEGTA